jgi:hypothetical protein
MLSAGPVPFTGEGDIPDGNGGGSLADGNGNGGGLGISGAEPVPMGGNGC